MWLIDTTDALFTDLYELTMAQAYFRRDMDATAYFEVFIRHLPEHWGFFVMAGLSEVQDYLGGFRFAREDIAYLRSTGLFADDFLEHLAALKLDVKVRTMPEGTIFFPNEPVMEVSGPILRAQLLETYILNILGFSIIGATLATRMVLAAGDISVIDFGLRRCQGPVSSLRVARGGQIAGFTATSNVFAARQLGLRPSGTMAHSFVQAHESEERAFRDFAEIYRENTILLVDTYDSIEGIKIAARVARDALAEGVRLGGIRLDSGDFVALSRFAREQFRNQGVEFLRIFASSDLDEFRIADLLQAGAEIDGFGVGTRFCVSQHAPAVGIVYKLAQYGDRPMHKSSPEKTTYPGRKMVIRVGDGQYEGDVVRPYEPTAKDLLKPFESAEPMDAIQTRLRRQLAALPDPVKSIRDPAEYPVEIADLSVKSA